MTLPGSGGPAAAIEALIAAKKETGGAVEAAMMDCLRRPLVPRGVVTTICRLKKQGTQQCPEPEAENLMFDLLAAEWAPLVSDCPDTSRDTVSSHLFLWVEDHFSKTTESGSQGARQRPDDHQEHGISRPEDLAHFLGHLRDLMHDDRRRERLLKEYTESPGKLPGMQCGIQGKFHCTADTAEQILFDFLADNWMYLVRAFNPDRGKYSTLISTSLERYAKTWLKEQSRRTRFEVPMPEHQTDEDGGLSELERILADTSPDNDVLAIVLQNEDLRLVLGALEEASWDVRRAVLLKELYDWSYDEVAVALQKPVGTIKSWINRAHKKLRKRLAGGKRQAASTIDSGIGEGS